MSKKKVKCLKKKVKCLKKSEDWVRIADPAIIREIHNIMNLKDVENTTLSIINELNKGEISVSLPYMMGCYLGELIIRINENNLDIVEVSDIIVVTILENLNDDLVLLFEENFSISFINQIYQKSIDLILTRLNTDDDQSLIDYIYQSIISVDTIIDVVSTDSKIGRASCRERV